MHQLNCNSILCVSMAIVDFVACAYISYWDCLPSQQERRILEETVMPLTPHSSSLPSPSRGGLSSASEPQNTIVRSLADWERKQELLERQPVRDLLVFISLSVFFDQGCVLCQSTSDFVFSHLQTLIYLIMIL